MSKFYKENFDLLESAEHICVFTPALHKPTREQLMKLLGMDDGAKIVNELDDGGVQFCVPKKNFPRFLDRLKMIHTDNVRAERDFKQLIKSMYERYEIHERRWKKTR